MRAQYFVATDSIGAPERDEAFWDALDQVRVALNAMGCDFEGPQTQSSAVQDIRAWFATRHDTTLRFVCSTTR